MTRRRSAGSASHAARCFITCLRIFEKVIVTLSLFLTFTGDFLICYQAQSGNMSEIWPEKKTIMKPLCLAESDVSFLMSCAVCLCRDWAALRATCAAWPLLKGERRIKALVCLHARRSPLRWRSRISSPPVNPWTDTRTREHDFNLICCSPKFQSFIELEENKTQQTGSVLGIGYSDVMSFASSGPTW